MTEWDALARRWRALDPDEATRGEVERLLGPRGKAELEATFSSPLAFGTAGLRGSVGAGPARMNLLTVISLALALGEFLRERFDSARVVLGYDARPDSERFAERICEELVRMGHEVHLVSGASPTPFVAYWTRHIGAKAGVAVTASHNPRSDAGVKVYDDLGVQIAPPWDVEIASRMGGDSALGRIGRLEERFRHAPGEVLCGTTVRVGAEQFESYFDWLVGIHREIDVSGDSLRVAYTPLSGVGFAPVAKLASRLNIELVVPLSERDPDGTFPHLPFPNPEEAGVLDELLKVAVQNNCDLGAANDPDADRLAVVLPGPRGEGLRMLSGDELGLLLADVWLEALAFERALVVATLVSSPAVDALAERHGAELRRTLTGFKWICRVANEDRFAFAYEEALGYCLARGAFRPVLDKDGLAAFALVCGAARRQARQLGLPPGQALRERLKQIAVQDGLWVASPRQARALDAASRERIFLAPDRLRQHLPAKICGFSLAQCKDYLGAASSDEFAGRQDLLSLFFERGDGVQARLHVRPSGTEAKLKFYVHVGAKLSSIGEYATQYDELSRLAHDLGTALMSELELTS